ncbi:MAG: chemotaxis protein [Anaerotignum sp.]|nr:chemotaxis protein [Anaerotignum sp.]
MSETSWQVKKRYNDKVYGVIKVQLPKDDVEEFKKICKEKGISQASVIYDFLKTFIEKNKKS